MNERTFSPTRAHILDDPERLKWLPPDQIIARVGLRPGMAVADVGAGTGYFTLPFSEVVGPSGKIHAVDFQADMLKKIRAKLDADKSRNNIALVSGSASATTLPEQSVDVVFMANLWHELDDFSAVLSEVKRILKPNGKLSIVDWRADLPSPPGPPTAHRVSVQAVQKTLESHGWKVVDTGFVGVYSHFLGATPKLTQT
ncbi:MAG: methyltransferase domain-containing protein [Bacteroidota bacterium]